MTPVSVLGLRSFYDIGYVSGTLSFLESHSLVLVRTGPSLTPPFILPSQPFVSPHGPWCRIR